MDTRSRCSTQKFVPPSVAIPIFCTGIIVLLPVLVSMALSRFTAIVAIVLYFFFACLFYYAAYRCQRDSPWSLFLSAICCVLLTLIWAAWHTTFRSDVQFASLLLGGLLGLYLLGYLVYRKYVHRPIQLGTWLLSARLLIYIFLFSPVCDVLADVYWQIADLNIGETIEDEEPDQTQEHTNIVNVSLRDNLARLTPLVDDEQWATLSQGEKLEILDIILQVERTYLGVPYELTLTVDDLPSEIAGHYNPAERCVTIDSEEIEFPLSSIQTICHESYHAYEDTMVELYDALPEKYRSLLAFDAVPTWEEEFINYVDGTGDTFDEYYAQNVEVAARAYANDAVLDYYTRIMNYIEEQQSE